ncbi:MAG: hypothetical protein WA940_00335 [Sphingopyxis sp.]
MTNPLIQTIARALWIAQAKGIADPATIWDRPLYCAAAQAALTALHDAGYAIVPREPTREMIDAAYAAHDAYEAAEPPAAWCGVSSIYRAMIAATTTGKAE